jgi:hypothetical protein
MLIEDDHSSRSTMLMIFLKKSFTNYNSIDIDYIKWWAREIRREVINKDKVKNLNLNLIIKSGGQGD